MKSKEEVMMMTANRGLPLSSKIFIMQTVLNRELVDRWTRMGSDRLLLERMIRVVIASTQHGNLFHFILPADA